MRGETSSQREGDPYIRKQIVARVLRRGWAVCDVAQAPVVSERPMYRWIARYRTEGRSGLRDRCCRVKRIAQIWGSDFRRLTNRPIAQEVLRSSSNGAALASMM